MESPFALAPSPSIPQSENKPTQRVLSEGALALPDGLPALRGPPAVLKREP
jgi:hypothetical protein